MLVGDEDGANGGTRHALWQEREVHALLPCTAHSNPPTKTNADEITHSLRSRQAMRRGNVELARMLTKHE